MKTSITYNQKEQIDVEYGTWVKVSEHWPDTKYKDYHYNDGEVDAEDFIKEVKKYTRVTLTVAQAEEYRKKYNYYGIGEPVFVSVIFKGRQFISVMCLNQHNHNDFCATLNDGSDWICSIKKTLNGTVFCNNTYNGGKVILTHWMPIPKINKWNDTNKKSPLVGTEVLCLNNQQKTLGYYLKGVFVVFDNGFADFDVKKTNFINTCHSKKWISLPNLPPIKF